MDNETEPGCSVAHGKSFTGNDVATQDRYRENYSLSAAVVRFSLPYTLGSMVLIEVMQDY